LWNEHLDPEFLCLSEGTAHQRHAGNTGWEAQIILDPRGSASLPTERAAVDRQDRQSFRAGIDRRRKTSRAGSDHDHVVQLVSINRANQADAPCKLAFTWISQQLTAGTEDERKLLRFYVEAFDKRLRAIVICRVEAAKRMAVAAQKVGQPQHIGVLFAADDDGPRAGLNEGDPA